MAPEALSDGDPLPRRFGRYVLFDKIGEGGMARIYLGRTKTDLGGERLVVVKQILPLLSASSEFSQLLIGEAKVVAQLSHGNIAQVFDLGREDDMLYIAMEYVEGFDLRDLLRHCSKNRVPLPVEFALLIVIEVLRALDYAHRKKDDAGRELSIVHRDVSPSNVLISFEGEVKLCDFGIARAMGASGSLPDEAIQGKTGYMSPEAASGLPLDARSDVFAAGIMLWELLAGRRLYRGQDGQPPSLEQAAAAQVPPLEKRGYPGEERLHVIVARALTKDRNERYASARAMLRELENYVASCGLVASPLRFGEWLMQHFGGEIVQRRRARERAAKAVEAGPLLELSPPSGPDTAPPPAPRSGSKPSPRASLDAVVTSPVPAPGSRGAWRWLLLLMVVAVAAVVAGSMILH